MESWVGLALPLTADNVVDGGPSERGEEVAADLLRQSHAAHRLANGGGA